MVWVRNVAYIVYTIYHSDMSYWSYVFSFRSDCPILNPGVIKLKDIFSWVPMTGCGQRVWIGYVLVLVASSFQKMRSKDIPHASLGLGKTVQPSGALYSSAQQWQGVQEPAVTLQLLSCTLYPLKNFIANTYVILDEIFRKIVAFQHLSLESTNCHSTFICTKREHKILHWPPASTWPGPLQPQGLRLDQPTAPSFSKPSNRISEPPDRGIFLAQVVALVNSSELFDGFLCWNQQHPKNQRFNKKEF